MINSVKQLRTWLVLWGLAIPAIAFAQAQSQVRLFLDKATVRPGGSVQAIIEITAPAGWHTYWRNPSEYGGTGLPTKVVWALPPGVVASGLQWPTPLKIVDPTGDFHAYEGVVRLVANLSLSTTVASGPLNLTAKVSWQECQKECVQGSATVSTQVTVGAVEASSGHEDDFRAAQAALPLTNGVVRARASWGGAPVGETRKLLVEWATESAKADFFAYEGKAAQLAAKTEVVSFADGKVVLRKEVQRGDDGWPTNVVGLLVAHPSDPDRRGFIASLPIEGSATGSSAEGIPGSATQLSTDWAAVVPMLGLAFLGGLILNIMPCVLPVLALKILGFVRQAGNDPAQVRRLGLVYGAGVLSSFLALGCVSLAVQAAGGVAGWSTAFQNPQFRVAMCVLLVLVTLNLFGVFEVTLGSAAMGGAGELTSKEGAAGAFFNGVLAAVLATPCTAPFLATAIGFAFTQPPLVLLGIFMLVGLGLASPFVVLCWRPGWLKLLPKPGVWMEHFKHAMGFPVLGTAVWIFWFTSKRMGDTGVLWLGLFLVVIAFASWVWGEFGQRGGRRSCAGLVAIGLLTSGYWLTLEHEVGWRERGGYRKPGLDWQSWSEVKVEAERQKGHPVLVDFTADNCANCKFNKATSIEIPSTIAKLRELGVAVMEGDFTDADPAIAEVLQRFGRRGVPLVLVYPKNPALDPKPLPVTLTPSIVQEALDWAAK